MTDLAPTPQAAADASASARRERAGGGARGAWAARTGGLPRAYWRIWTGTLINRLGTFVEPFLALYLTTSRGLSVANAGWVVAAYGAGSVLAQPVGGTLADRAGRRITLVGSLGLSAVLLSLLAVVHGVALVVLVVVVLGIVGDAFRPASQAAVADLVALEERRRAAGLLFWAVNLGFSAAAVVGGLLAAAGYGLLFALDALTCAAFAVIFWRTVPETRPAEAVRRATGSGYLAVLSDRVFAAFLVVQLVAATAFIQLFSVLPLSMDHDGIGAATYGAVVALNGVVIVALHPVLAPALLRRDPARVLALSGLLTAAGCLGFAAADGTAAYAAAVVVFSVGEIGGAAVAGGLAGELAPPALRGRYSGAFGLTFGIAGTVAPLLGTQLLGEGDSPWPWFVAGALAAAAAAGFLALGPALARRRGRAATASREDAGR